ncbi:MAG: DUF4215 domain-containing protein [Polyangiaceae bacterium]|nr:DUF4215 domain-containing protein [Polyangiaceae bacterium]
MKSSFLAGLVGIVFVSIAVAQACSSGGSTTHGEAKIIGASGSGPVANEGTGGDAPVGMIDPTKGGGMVAGGAASCGAAMCMEKMPACGDSVLDPGEKCDDGNAQLGDGCGANCDAVDKDFACVTPGMACVSTVTCGDSKITGTETCDDGNAAAGDGCDAKCLIEAGYKCPAVGAHCVAAQCGDSKIAGSEECDDGNPTAGDGCSATCTLEPKFKCDVPGAPCAPTVCGDGKAEGGEQCDDQNFNTGDGCSPFCRSEPVCVNGACQAKCGDGLKLDSEECDDGNARNFDGCSSACKIEAGFTCTVTKDPPVLPVVYRDFVGTDDSNEDTGPRHPDFENDAIVNDGCQQVVENVLDPQGKPKLAAGGTKSCLQSAASFAQWYRSDNTINRTVADTLVMTPVANMADTFQFEDPTFFPLDGRGFNDPNAFMEFPREGDDGPHNFGFTSELRYWFTYRGGEKLTFYGDDDVWVFINGRLAVALPGLHPAEERWILLGPPGVGATGAGIHPDGYPASMGFPDIGPAGMNLEVGKVYEVAVFQAERHTNKSGYKLTIQNFLNGRSVCKSTCGDGVVASNEACDKGANDGSYGGCNMDCTLGPRCGDGVVQAAAGEACDDGLNLTSHAASATAGGCAPDCKKPGFCGDGVVDSVFGEACDDGANVGGYGKCAPECRAGEYCGDGKINGQEQCDDGNKAAGDGCSPGCVSDLR